MAIPVFGNDVVVTFKDVDPQDVRRIVNKIQSIGLAHHIDILSYFSEERLKASETELNSSFEDDDSVLRPTGDFVETTEQATRVYGGWPFRNAEDNDLFDHHSKCALVSGPDKTGQSRVHLGSCRGI